MFLKNSKGQSSFEMMFVIAVIIILASFIIVAGTGNLNEVAALGYTHNTINKQMVTKNTSAKLIGIETNTSEDTIEITIKTTETMNLDTEELKEKIIKNTKYKEVIFN
jgi:hypothetical protein